MLLTITKGGLAFDANSTIQEEYKKSKLYKVMPPKEYLEECERNVWNFEQQMLLIEKLKKPTNDTLITDYLEYCLENDEHIYVMPLLYEKEYTDLNNAFDFLRQTDVPTSQNFFRFWWWSNDKTDEKYYVFLVNLHKTIGKFKCYTRSREHMSLLLRYNKTNQDLLTILSEYLG